MKISNLNRLFLIQMFHQAGLWIAIIFMPILISQKGTGENLMEEDQMVKGFIFFFWILLQNLIGFSFGIYADKIGRKRTLFISHILMILGYVILANTINLSYFLIGILFLGLGSGLYKPVLEGSIASEIDNNDRKAWKNYIIFINFGVIISFFILEFFIKYLSLESVFVLSAFFLILNFPLILFTKLNFNIDYSPFKELKKSLLNKDLLKYVLIFSGFTTIYMQFYEMLPNFIFDWVDSRDLASIFPYFSEENALGKVITYKWFYLLNPLFIILTISFFYNKFSKYSIKRVLIFGMLFVLLGWFFAGISQNYLLLIAGILIYTIGEMTIRPNLYNLVLKDSKIENKIISVNFINLSYFIGYSIGAISGGYIYREFGEKAIFAKKHLLENFNLDISASNALKELSKRLDISGIELTKKLWQENDPYLSFLPYLLIGLFSLYFIIKIKEK